MKIWLLVCSGKEGWVHAEASIAILRTVRSRRPHPRLRMIWTLKWWDWWANVGNVGIESSFPKLWSLHFLQDWITSKLLIGLNFTPAPLWEPMGFAFLIHVFPESGRPLRQRQPVTTEDHALWVNMNFTPATLWDPMGFAFLIHIVPESGRLLRQRQPVESTWSWTDHEISRQVFMMIPLTDWLITAASQWERLDDLY